jgi:hypothetical protein
MHPGPINRGVELSSDAADSPHSIILDQVENGVCGAHGGAVFAGGGQVTRIRILQNQV